MVNEVDRLDQLERLARDAWPHPGKEMLQMIDCIRCADMSMAVTGADRRDAEDDYHKARAELDGGQ